MIRTTQKTNAKRQTRPAGFTLAELIVATTILTIVMTAVYTAFGSTLQTWRQGEANLYAYQDARSAINIMAREFNSILSGSEFLFQGEDDELEFFAVTPPMDVSDGEGERLLWIRYHYDRSNDRLIRQEATVKKPLPLEMPGTAESEDPERISLGRKIKFCIAENVKDFEITYYWIPPVPHDLEIPPEWVEPIVKEENREGWGLPQGIKVVITLKDLNAEKGRTDFTFQTAFHGPTTPYNQELIGELDELFMP